MTIVLIFLLGLMLNSLVAGGIFQKMEQRLTQVPFIKAIYSPLRDLMNLFSKGTGPGGFKKSFLSTWEILCLRSLGLVTRETFHDIPAIEKMRAIASPCIFP